MMKMVFSVSRNKFPAMILFPMPKSVIIHGGE